MNTLAQDGEQCLRTRMIIGKVHPFPTDPQVSSLAPPTTGQEPMTTLERTLAEALTEIIIWA